MQSEPTNTRTLSRVEHRYPISLFALVDSVEHFVYRLALGLQINANKHGIATWELTHCDYGYVGQINLEAVNDTATILRFAKPGLPSLKEAAVSGRTMGDLFNQKEREYSQIAESLYAHLDNCQDAGDGQEGPG